MKRMAILHMGDLEKVSIGGIDRYVKNVICYSSDYEITVYGICRKGDYELDQKYERYYNGRNYYFIPVCTDEKHPLTLSFLRIERKWMSEWDKYDVVYMQRIEYTLPYFFRRKNNLVQIIHGSGKYYEYSYGKLRFFFYSLMERASVAIAKKTFIIMNNEEYGVPFYKRKYKSKADRFYYAINPIDISVYHKNDKNEAKEKIKFGMDKKVILYLGRVIHNPKRVLLLPDILKELDGTYVCVVVGDGPDLVNLKNKVEEYGLTKRFRFAGYIDDTAVICDYINASDVVVNCSMYEGTCTSNIESVACGVPVVSTDVGEIRQLIHDKTNGIIVSNSNEEQISKDVARAVLDITLNDINMDETYLMYDGKNAIDRLLSEMV